MVRLGYGYGPDFAPVVRMVYSLKQTHPAVDLMYFKVCIGAQLNQMTYYRLKILTKSFVLYTPVSTAMVVL